MTSNMSNCQLSYNPDIQEQSAWLTVTPSATAKATFFYVQEVGDFYSRKRYFTKRENLASYFLQYTYDGRGVMQYDGEEYQLEAGSLLWIDCKKSQYYYTHPQASQWHNIWVHFYGATSSGYYEQFLSANNAKNVLYVPAHAHIPGTIEEILRLFTDEQAGLTNDIRASNLLMQLMSETLLLTMRTHNGAIAPDAVLGAMKHMAANFQNKITLDCLAEQCNLNKFYLQKLFKKHTGYTPNEYLILARISKAKELLRSTALNVNEIAMEVGMENVSHFINQFKKHEGTTPGAYRKHWSMDT